LSGNVPAFPFTTLASDPQAIQKWFAALVQGEIPQIATWLQNLMGLLGVKNANVTPVGTPPTQWIVPVFDIGSASNSNLAIVVGLQSATNAIAMQIGLQATILPSDPAPPVRIEAPVDEFLREYGYPPMERPRRDKTIANPPASA